MQRPTAGDVVDLKRLARYLEGAAEVKRTRKRPMRIDVYVDSDHASCGIARRSTTGLVVMLEGDVVKTKS